MAVIFSDDFNRANADLLGANWQAEVTVSGTSGDVDIVSNRAQCTTKGTGSFVYVATTTTGHAALADCKVQVTQVQSGSDGAPAARITEADATPTMYVTDIFTNTLETLRYNNSGTSTSLQSSGVTSVANGVAALQVTGSGATVTLKAFYQGVQVGADISDASGSRITAAGQTGIVYYVANPNGDYDDFSVDDLAAGSVSRTPTIGAATLAGIAPGRVVGTLLTPATMTKI